MTSDVLSDASLATVASFGYGYGYDTDGNLTSKSVGLAGNPQSGAHTFGYDHQGRLIGWTGPSGTVAYTWDDRGNRLTAGADVYTYDERNRMLSGPCIALGFLETLDLGSEDGVMSKNQMAPTTRRYSAEFNLAALEAQLELRGATEPRDDRDDLLTDYITLHRETLARHRERLDAITYRPPGWIVGVIGERPAEPDRRAAWNRIIDRAMQVRTDLEVRLSQSS
jgi:YD repeat-containing protein